MKWITKNIGVIIVVTILFTVVTPYLFTGFKIDFSNTGSIGDTIGGITAPFLGLLSVILLYITFKEQREFNKTQCSANDWNTLFEIKNTIEKYSDDIIFELYESCQWGAETKQYKGLNNFDEVKSNYFNKNTFENAYKDILLIADLCILFYEVSNKSLLSKEVKEALNRVVNEKREKVVRFLLLIENYNKKALLPTIEIKGNNYSIIEKKKTETSKYIQRLQISFIGK